MSKILVVEDEESFRDALAFMLTKEGFDVVLAATGLEGIQQFESENPDLVLLDLMLPEVAGTEVCKYIRTKATTPIIMLTAKDTEVDKVVGLELGADDYVTKPFSTRELIARIRAVLRRGSDNDENAVANDVLRVGNVRMDVDRHELSVNGQEVVMPLREFELLELLMRNAGRVLTRGQLMDRIWGANYVGDGKTLDVHIKRIRAKIEADPANPVLLSTVRGLGYRYEAKR